MEKQEAQLLTISEVCKILCVKESWLRLRLFKDEIPHVKMGGLVRFKRTTIERIIKHGLLIKGE